MHMSDLVNVRELAARVRARRGARGLREAAADIGHVSPATLSRVEQGHTPDLETFLRLCNWLGEPPQSFTASTRSKEGDERGTPAIIAAHLRADPTLSARAADALSMTIELAYQAAIRDDTADPRP
jgi:transcriptional regulator with XRE-family HTH domain